MTDTEVREEVRHNVFEDGDHERLTHIVYPKDALTQAMVMGTPVTALCGKLWVPNRDPDKFPVCKQCVEEFEKVMGRPWPGRR